jgi:hypothetical protein
VRKRHAGIFAGFFLARRVSIPLGNACLLCLSLREQQSTRLLKECFWEGSWEAGYILVCLASISSLLYYFCSQVMQPKEEPKPEPAAEEKPAPTIETPQIFEAGSPV